MGFDLNSPWYHDLYSKYYRFFNKNLNRLKSVLKNVNKKHDLNFDIKRKRLNPESFNYKKYFDDFNELETLPGPHLDMMRVHTDGDDIK